MAAGGNNSNSTDIFGCQDDATLLSNEKLPPPSELLVSFWLPNSSPSLLGPKSMRNFEDVGGGGSTKASPFQSLDKQENASEEFGGGCFSQTGKKRRLTASQIVLLEKNFEVENKLEQERKRQLATELGLQPRQVAIWFQNRRARSKNQRLAKDYDSLKAVYDKLKDDYANLLREKQVLQKEVMILTRHIKEKEKDDLERYNAIKSQDVAEPQDPISNSETEAWWSYAPMATSKQEYANSGKSNIFESDSPHYTDGNNSSSLVDATADSSQDEDGSLCRLGLLPPPCTFSLKLEEDCSYGDQPADPPTDSSYFGFSLEDHPFWSWPY